MMKTIRSIEVGMIGVEVVRHVQKVGQPAREAASNHCASNGRATLLRSRIELQINIANRKIVGFCSAKVP
jgi:hypothetical protein